MIRVINPKLFLRKFHHLYRFSILSFIPCPHAQDIGVYYLQAPKNSGNLRFDETNKIIEPIDGKFVIIPKLTVHSMAENKSNGIRLAMGFPFEVIEN